MSTNLFIVLFSVSVVHLIYIFFYHLLLLSYLFFCHFLVVVKNIRKNRLIYLCVFFSRKFYLFWRMVLVTISHIAFGWMHSVLKTLFISNLTKFSTTASHKSEYIWIINHRINVKFVIVMQNVSLRHSIKSSHLKTMFKCW